MASITVIEGIQVTAELTGTQMSRAAVDVMAEGLSRYPDNDVLFALARCRNELRHRLTQADVIARLPRMWPPAAEAWAQCPHDEWQTVVWTQEATKAYAVARPLLEDGDKYGARQAFTSAYEAAVAEAITMGRQAKWVVSLGWDASARHGPIAAAVERGLLSSDSAYALLPHIDDAPPEIVRQLAKRLTVGGER